MYMYMITEPAFGATSSKQNTATNAQRNMSEIRNSNAPSQQVGINMATHTHTQVYDSIKSARTRSHRNVITNILL